MLVVVAFANVVSTHLSSNRIINTIRFELKSARYDRLLSFDGTPSIPHLLSGTTRSLPTSYDDTSDFTAADGKYHFIDSLQSLLQLATTITTTDLRGDTRAHDHANTSLQLA